ncbi:30S ribosome-binding factor RbfA [Hymenobacter sp. BRD128]|uniref:30S ribosome-binding factor RbfA n=1 Tax=Hymenobacter sp. BRD128 TaxID=2675878 RepID=UPI001567358C|nr:30S ribosome-binding factor RbfA [Hymenobacter sp. BRD128]QKG57898.1 30S ribosome-binding factor RbfA [Hymenobacter sp. BRD128]
MESKRQQKMASLLQQELAQVLQRDLPHLFSGGLVPSISTVKVTPDLAVARVYLSLLIGNDAPERLAAIKEHTKEIRHALGKRIRNQARVVPELTFFHDDSAAYAAHMDQVLSKLDIPAAPPADSDDDSTTDVPRPRLFNPKNEE